MNKAVIFDGDGTLWRPIKSSSDTRPDIIYQGNQVEDNSYLKLKLVDGISETLSYLRDQNYKIFVVSAHPTPGEKALKELESKITGLGISNFIDKFFCSSGSDRNSKTEVILDIIYSFQLDPHQTFMIGDSYYYDYEAGKNAGVNSFFIRNNYCKQPSPLPADTLILENVNNIKAALTDD